MGPVEGNVKTWDDERGWGIAASADAPGDVWVHFSVIQTDDYRSLEPGEAIRLTYEEAPEEMYGCRYQATHVERVDS